MPFYFFLDPNAGKKIVYDQTGKVRFEDETSEEGFHYTHQTTKRYRKRFGYWNYHATYETSFLLPSEENGEVSSTESSIGLKVCGLQSEMLEIPSELIEIGMAYLSAFVHFNTNLFIWLEEWGVDNWNNDNLISDNFLATLACAPSILPKYLRILWAVLNTEDWYPLDDDDPMVSNEVYKNIFSKENLFFINMLTDRIDRVEEFLYKKALELNTSLPKVLQAAEIARTLQSRSDIEGYREIEIQGKRYSQMEIEFGWVKKYLSEEDKKALLQTLEEKLSALDIEEAMEIVLQTWEETRTTSMQEKYQSLSQFERELVHCLVKKRLAYEMDWHRIIKKEEKQLKKLIDIRDSFSALMQKYYPLNQVEKDLLHHLVRERIQQLESMKMAMNNFLDAIYES